LVLKPGFVLYTSAAYTRVYTVTAWYTSIPKLLLNTKYISISVYLENVNV